MTRTLAVLLLIVTCLALWQWREATAAESRATIAEGALVAARQALTKEQAARAEEARRGHELQEALNVEHTARLALEDDQRRADAAAVSLRQRARQLAAAARCAPSNPETAAGGPAAETPGDLLAVMLERLDERAGELARYADQARLAGQLCERAYDALTPLSTKDDHEDQQVHDVP